LVVCFGATGAGKAAAFFAANLDSGG
jgi:hypothetical protein